MSGLIDSIRGAWATAAHTLEDAQKTVVAVVDEVVEDGREVVQAASVVGGALRDGAGDVATAVGQEGVVEVATRLFAHNVDVARQVVDKAQHSTPQEFVDWLAGPDGPHVADETALVPGLQKAIGEVMDTCMDNPVIAGAIGKAFGFKYVPGGDFYTTGEHSLQSYLGFHAIYDKVGKALGMDLQDNTMEFSVHGVDYKLELWKGNYGSGGAYGGEIGLYTRGAAGNGPLENFLEKIPGYYSSAKGDSQIRMTQTIYDKTTGKPLFENAARGADGPDGKHYWNLAIRTDPGVDPKTIGQRGTLETSDPDMAQAIYAQMKANPSLSDVTISKNDSGVYSVSYDWP